MSFIEPRSDGTFRVRARVDGKRRTIATGLAEAEAVAIADAAAIAAAAARVRHEARPAPVSLYTAGLAALDEREARGVRGITVERQRWSAYFERDPIGSIPVGGLLRRDVLGWLRRRASLAAQTQRNALNLLRAVLQHALDRGLCGTNVARDVRVPKQASATDRTDLEGVLRPDEQRRLLGASGSEWPVLLLALTTGLRQSELWHLEWQDVDLARGVITVRRSRGRAGTKSGRARRVPILPEARQALDALPRASRWVCPAPRGGQRHDGTTPRHWPRWQREAELDRGIRWHDLRHTCATSLLAGWWGRRWTLEEVRSYLGHSTVRVTERYARLVDELANDAAAATAGAGLAAEVSLGELLPLDAALGMR